SVARLIHRSPDRRMQLAIQAGHGSSVEDDCRVIELTSGNLGESQNGRHRVAGKRRKNSAELTAFHVHRKIDRTCRVVRQTSKDGLRAAEDLHSLGFTPVDSLADELDGGHGARGKERSLECGNLQKSSSGRRALHRNGLSATERRLRTLHEPADDVEEGNGLLLL